MRVVVPFIEIHPAADAALRKIALQAERVAVEKTFGYSQLLARLWAERQSFLNVEQDVELTLRAYRQALYCRCEWGVSPYRGSGTGQNLFKRSLGCTRFRSSLLERLPMAVNDANSIDDEGSTTPPGHWKRLDGRLSHVLDKANVKPHLHDEVPHHHVYDGHCACGSDHG